MAFSGALPKVVADTGLGGNLFSNYNAVQEAALKNHMQQLQNQFYGPTQQAAIDNTNAITNKLNVMTPLDAQNQQNINDWYGQKMQSDIGLQGAQTGYYGSETGINQLKMKNPGLMGGEDAQNVALGQMSAQPGQNPLNNLYSQLAQAKIAQQNAMAQFYNNGGNQLGVGAKETRNFQNQLMQEYGYNPQQALEAANAMMSGQKTFTDGSALPTPSALDQESMNRIGKYGTTSAGMNQVRSDTILDGLLKQGDALMPGASQFAGLAGKSGKPFAQFAASVGADDPNFQDYQTFTRQVVPQVANQMLLTEGARANNTQKAMMMKVADPTYWDSNPQAAMKQWKYLTDTFKYSVGGALSKGYAQQKQALSDASKGGTGSGMGGRVRVQSPDGKMGSIPAENLQKALQSGYKQVQ